MLKSIIGKILSIIGWGLMLRHFKDVMNFTGTEAAIYLMKFSFHGHCKVFFVGRLCAES